ncbi:hypothetical protein [Amaricoccus solimangrovi]|uniref:Uncharacterized protein n=1 Tax=Amaricoccus solimangrovi TaxID=2589815 RepID=A0A501X0T3_9RHOB|nr:hypothetical protein [Amaricoccus solimangrovi]TPE52606.1 hypothetical protein FJM51_05355 [Amaricoccus solimangrovi]
MSDTPRPDFEAQHRPDRAFPIYDCRVLRLAEDAPDFAVLSARELAALAASYALDALIYAHAAARAATPIARDIAEAGALTARLHGHCARARLGRRARSA